MRLIMFCLLGLASFGIRAAGVEFSSAGPAALERLPSVPQASLPKFGDEPAPKALAKTVPRHLNASGKAMEMALGGDIEKAIAYARANYQREPSSAYFLGVLYQAGSFRGQKEVVKVDLDRSESYFKECHPVLAPCTFELGVLAKTRRKAGHMELFKSAANRGYLDAMTAYGMELGAVGSTDQSKQEAGRWLWAAHLLGSSGAKPAFEALGLSDARESVAHREGDFMAKRVRSGQKAIKKKHDASTPEFPDPLVDVLRLTSSRPQ